MDEFDREQLVYLSADAKEEMLEFDVNKVYIIGGMVDRNSLKCATLNKSKKLSVQCLKFPIRKHLNLKGSPILTVNQSFDVLISFS